MSAPGDPDESAPVPGHAHAFDLRIPSDRVQRHAGSIQDTDQVAHGHSVHRSRLVAVVNQIQYVIDTHPRGSGQGVGVFLVTPTAGPTEGLTPDCE